MFLDYEPDNVVNLKAIIESQREKMATLRKMVRDLEFIPVDPTGMYVPITFKSFDGGTFNLHFDPFEFDIVEVADSNGNRVLNFAAPGGDLLDGKDLGPIISDLDSNEIIGRFLRMMGTTSLLEASDIPNEKGTLMEIGELACIFDKVHSSAHDGQTIILKDGLLRTKKLKPALIGHLKNVIAEKSEHVKVVGVAKTSKVLFLLQTALLCERVFPRDQIGYIKVPLEIENMAYKWRGRLVPGGDHGPLKYAFGRLYIAKLSRSSNLLVTVEIPDSFDTGKRIYTNNDVMEILGYLARDSAHSYPIIGYPQTIMRAHEFATRLGLPSSILRDRIMSTLVREGDESFAEYVRDSEMLGAWIDRSALGGNS